jgi:hypothetical protein
MQEIILQRPRRKALKEHQVWDEILLYAPEQDAAFSLNSSAKAIWELCDGRRSLADICQLLGERFDCPSDTLLSDVKNAILQLQKLGLVELEESFSATPSPSLHR